MLGQIDANALQLWRENPVVGGEVHAKRAGDLQVIGEIANVLERRTGCGWGCRPLEF
jgi:hypothetical protein